MGKFKDFFNNIKEAFLNNIVNVIISIIILTGIYYFGAKIGVVEILISIVSMVKAVEFLDENNPRGDTYYYIKECEKLDKIYKHGLISKQSYSERKNELIEKYKKNHKK